MTAVIRSRGLAAAAAICLQWGVSGCVESEPETATTAQAATVGSFVGSTGCSTGVVYDLSVQIAEEVQCLLPGQLVPFAEGDGIVFAGTVLPWIDAEAKADLLAAAQSGELDVTSAYRTVVQQYLLYAWYQAGRCGITAAANPGESNHESGRAVDISNYGARIAAMEANGWAHDVPGDDVHFDHLSSPDIRGSDVQAFQRLWNRNHPEAPIDEDGFWGPMTENALAASPAEGFPIGASCDPDQPPDPDPVPGDDDGGDDDGGVGDAVGGCSAGGGAGGAGTIALILAFTVRGRGRRTGSTPRRR